MGYEPLMPRLFIAIDMSESIRRKIAWLDIPAAGVVRVTPPDDLHITLHFIGEVPVSLSDVLQTRLRSVTASSFVVELSGVGAFANRGRPEILWAGIVQSAELLSLRAAVGDVLKSLEIRLDDREFNPHVTVARMKRRSPVMAAEFAERNASFHARFTATSFSLYCVAPNGREPHYRAVEEYSVSSLSPFSQSGDDVQTHGADGGQDSAEQAHDEGEHHALREDTRAEPE